MAKITRTNLCSSNSTPNSVCKILHRFGTIHSWCRSRDIRRHSARNNRFKFSALSLKVLLKDSLRPSVDENLLPISNRASVSCHIRCTLHLFRESQRMDRRKTKQHVQLKLFASHENFWFHSLSQLALCCEVGDNFVVRGWHQKQQLRLIRIVRFAERRKTHGEPAATPGQWVGLSHVTVFLSRLQIGPCPPP